MPPNPDLEVPRGDCSRAGRIIGGCRFQPRYDDVVNMPGKLTTSPYDSWQSVMSAFREKRYVADVCTRCGRSVARPETGETAEG